MSIILPAYRGFWKPKTSSLLTNLVSYWKLDEASGTAIDSKGANDLTAVNNPLGVTGKINNGREFVRTSGKYLNNAAPVGLAPTTNDFSFSCWLKSPTTPNYRTIINYGAQANTNSYLWIYNSTNIINIEFHNGVGSFTKLSSGISITTNFQHFVFVFNRAGNLVIYVNNVNSFSSSISSKTGSISPSGSFYLGTYQNSASSTYCYDGVIDEAGWWSRALATAEITALYNGGAGKSYPF